MDEFSEIQLLFSITITIDEPVRLNHHRHRFNYTTYRQVQQAFLMPLAKLHLILYRWLKCQRQGGCGSTHLVITVTHALWYYGGERLIEVVTGEIQLNHLVPRVPKCLDPTVERFILWQKLQVNIGATGHRASASRLQQLECPALVLSALHALRSVGSRFRRRTCGWRAHGPGSTEAMRSQLVILLGTLVYSCLPRFCLGVGKEERRLIDPLGQLNRQLSLLAIH